MNSLTSVIISFNFLAKYNRLFFSVNYQIFFLHLGNSRDSSVGIALGYGLDDRGSRVRFPAGAAKCLHHRVQNGSGVHPASYPMGTRGSFPGGKSAGAWSWPLTLIHCRGQECVKLTSTPQYIFMVWCLVKYRDNFSFYLFLLHLGPES
jgi:hypothetical protein